MPDTTETIEQVLLRHVRDGYRVIWKDMYSAQLVKPKQFNMGAAVAFAVVCPALGLFLALLTPAIGMLVIYFCFYVTALNVLGYLGARDATVFLFVDGMGVVGTVLS